VRRSSEARRLSREEIVNRLIDMNEYFITMVFQSAPAQSRTERLGKDRLGGLALEPDAPHATFCVPER
jgi:hypothetical protein